MPRPSCQQCQRPSTVCLCHTITAITNRWPIIILQHPDEAKHAIGTAIIAQLSLSQCQTISYVSKEDSSKTNTNVVPGQQSIVKIISQQQPLLVFPDEDGQSIDKISTEELRPLLFLDGTWRKSRRMKYETPELAALPKVTIHSSPSSRYRIRKTPNENALSTLEAIAYSLATLEQNKEKYQPLLTSMDWMIDQQINAMGPEVYRQNYDGE